MGLIGLLTLVTRRDQFKEFSGALYLALEGGLGPTKTQEFRPRINFHD